MASSSTTDKAGWQEGDTCLAPSSRDGTLRAGTLLKVSSTSHAAPATAPVRFTDHYEEDSDEEEEVETILVPKLQRPGSDGSSMRGCSAQEKPLFHTSSLNPPGPPEPLVLSQNGDRVPYTINRYLRDYQREGIRFLYYNYTKRRGCILGDDMGLGKTVQVIGFLAAVLHKTGTWEDIENNRPQFVLTQACSEPRRPNKAFLIVAPLSVVYNWKDELETWGHFQVVVVHGLRKEEELSRVRRGRSEIALTTYETLRLCLDLFNSVDWCAVIVDECHKIKNPDSQITQAMKELRCRVRMGLTGTILQNNLDELWCVMDWAIPGCLGSLGHFKNKFSDPIEQGQRHSATKRSLASGRNAVQILARKLSHWFLRRTKALISDQLPKKDDRVVYCSLTEFQRTVYRTVLETEDVTLLLRSSEKCDCGSGRTRRKCCYTRNSEGAKMRFLYFSYLAILRKVANHVALLQTSADTSKNQVKYVSAICEKVFQKFPEFVQRCKHESFEAMSDPMYSGKMKVLQKLLKHYVQRKDKVLLFSLSTKLLNVLESYCMAEGLDYSRLDGTTNAKDRMKIVKEFNSCPDINLCLVSTMAGGLGLNFVGANVVVLFDPTWNPANDLQAIDRAYRIGQCRDVTVLRLISLGTVEEIIYLRQIYKQQLQCSAVGRESARRYFEAVQGANSQKGELFGIKNLFRLQTQGTCLTRKILEREGRVEVGVMTTSTHTGEEKEEEEEEEEERKRGSEPGAPGVPPSEPGSGAAGGTRGAARTPRGVLDFSSGSEDEEERGRSRRKAPEPERAPSTSPGLESLLRHGFSRLLLGSGVTADSSQSEGPESGGGSDCEEDGSGNVGQGAEESDDTEREKTGSAGMKSRRKRMAEEARDEDSGSSSDAVAAKTALPTMQRLGFDSDESDDLDIEVMTRPKEPFLQRRPQAMLRGRGGQRRATGTAFRAPPGKPRPGSSRRTEDIETFTSSDEELSPVKKGSSVGRHLAAPQTDRPRAARQMARPGPPGQTDRPAVSFTGLKNNDVPHAATAAQGTIDHLLGGVQEVVYTHSNQRVVGGSKAEERISRAALRHVFEHKMYSQLPANQLLESQESQGEQTPPATPGRSEVSWGLPLRAAAPDHPVTHTARSVHTTTHTTFIIGETPGAMRRQQLEAMAAVCGAQSVRRFAEEVLRSTSAQRLAQLRQFYTSQSTELATVVRENYPEPVTARAEPERAAQPSSSSSSSSSSKPKNRKSFKRTHHRAVLEQEPQPADETPRRSVEPQRAVLFQEDEENKRGQEARGGKRRKKEGSGSRTSRVAGLSSPEWASSRSVILGPGEAATSLDQRDSDHGCIPSSSAIGRGRPTQAHATVPEQGTGRGLLVATRESETPQLPSFPKQQRLLLSELIGDTSILDDLFKPKRRTPEQRGSPKTPPATIPRHGTNTPPSGPSTTVPPSPRVSSAFAPSSSAPSRAPPTTPPERSKGSRKDFWDILSEGNEESINRLTDMREVERVCVSTKLAAKTSGGEERENAALWKRNDKFLWK